MFQLGEAVLRIKPVCVACCEYPAAKALQLRMRKYRLHQPFAQTAAAEFIEHEHIAKVGERSLIANDAGKSDLTFVDVHAKADRVCDGSFSLLSCPVVCPVRIFDQKGLDHIDIQSMFVITDREFTLPPLHNIGLRDVYGDFAGCGEFNDAAPNAHQSTGVV